MNDIGFGVYAIVTFLGDDINDDQINRLIHEVNHDDDCREMLLSSLSGGKFREALKNNIFQFCNYTIH